MKKSLTHLVLFAAVTAIFAIVSTGCGTVQGIGRDVGSLGRGIEKATR